MRKRENFDCIIGLTYIDVVMRFPRRTVYTYENVAEIELDEGTLACYFQKNKCYEWSFFTNDENGLDYHSCAHLFPIQLCWQL